MTMNEAAGKKFVATDDSQLRRSSFVSREFHGHGSTKLCHIVWVFGSYTHTGTQKRVLRYMTPASIMVKGTQKSS